MSNSNVRRDHGKALYLMNLMRGTLTVEVVWAARKASGIEMLKVT